MGHVRDLPKKSLGVDLEHEFKPEYVISAGKAKIVRQLKQSAKKASSVILATDLDREGEAIAFHIQYLLSEKRKAKSEKQKFYRIVFHEITKTAIEQALKNPGQVDLKLVDAQAGRRILDRLVGYQLSPILWRKVRRGLSAGRVQSVAVRLVVEREEEIKAFIPETYWVVGASLKKGEENFKAYLKKITDQVRAEQAAAALKQAQYSVKEVKTRQVKQWPWPPLMTSSLQRTAGARLGWSAKKTMYEAQNLYEQGLITYHRTDSLSLNEEAVGQARKFISQKFGAQYLPDHPVFYKTKAKSAQAAHEAIRPTEVNFQSDNKLYKLIWERFVACQMSPAVINRTKVTIQADKYELFAEGEKLVFDGWMRINEKLKPKNEKLPELKEGDKLDLIKVLSEKKFTQPPGRYTEAGLIKVLEEKEIGRPSTYAPILSTIQDRHYVEKEDKKLKPTAIGQAVTRFLLKYFPKIMNYEFTAKMEGDLDEIAKGRQSSVSVLKNFYSSFSDKLNEVKEKAERVVIETEKTGEKCPECKQGEVVIRIGRFGKFLSCSRFPDCKYTKNYKEIVAGANCPKCQGEVVVKKSRKRKQFYGCANYPKCQWASWNKPTASGSEPEVKD
ncbi:MAG: topoisomerase protein [Candidatus Beckwithbacteria bacterium GW2011_GWA2_43_10]|uniref:DNA topoisomerase 1 n=1 Tax=Candidatus Beckwithbacteria bacterium GW2011_GWA2_43_10 TaxID=1618369 RepID=A0A0G1C550_9BACT|nr:MAG: topoisomerase protein [Candidatus Beckwithbacteria bacterium GW2011_GWA2_43_10]